MALGPVMLDVAGTELDAADRELLRHPNTGGVILFTRNFENPRQLAALIHDIHAQRDPHLLVAVDQEGGRVQRFREGFSAIPAMAALGAHYDRSPAATLADAEQVGWLLAAELLVLGVDFTFAPVLDLRRGISAVIGDRALHPDPDAVTALAAALVRGMASAGMSAVGKHFPGHGSVAPDSHEALPIDERSYHDILQLDAVPFERMIHKGLPALMPAHIRFPAVDTELVGYSRVWLQEILRERLGFMGAVFSDDLSMAGAATRPEVVDRARAALDAGCDMVLICNDRPAAARVVESLESEPRPLSQSRLIRMHGHASETVTGSMAGTMWDEARAAVERMNEARGPRAH